MLGDECHCMCMGAYFSRDVFMWFHSKYLWGAGNEHSVLTTSTGGLGYECQITQ